jgi:hypothetical protein
MLPRREGGGLTLWYVSVHLIDFLKVYLLSTGTIFRLSREGHHQYVTCNLCFFQGLGDGLDVQIYMLTQHPPLF